MSEYQLFCYSKEYNNDESFQQKRYRVFNRDVGERRYWEIKSKVKEILGNPDKQLSDFWESVSKEQWDKLRTLAKEVRGDDFKEGFEYISGVKLDDNQIIIAKQPVEIFKDKIKVGCTEVSLDTIDKIIQEMKKR